MVFKALKSLAKFIRKALKWFNPFKTKKTDVEAERARVWTAVPVPLTNWSGKFLGTNTLLQLLESNDPMETRFSDDYNTQASVRDAKSKFWNPKVLFTTQQMKPKSDPQNYPLGLFNKPAQN